MVHSFLRPIWTLLVLTIIIYFFYCHFCYHLKKHYLKKRLFHFLPRITLYFQINEVKLNIVSKTNSVATGKKKLSYKNEASHQMALRTIIMLHLVIRCKYLIFMNGSLISVFKKISKFGGVGGKPRFLLATRNFCWLPTFFKFLEPWVWKHFFFQIKIKFY